MTTAPECSSASPAVAFVSPGRTARLQDVELKAGETRWLPDARRVARNLADAPVELLYIETKRPLT